MEIGSEAFGRCVEEIDVSVDAKYEGEWLQCEWDYLRFLLVEKAAQDLQWMWEMVPGIGYAFKCFYVLWELLKN